MAIERLISEHSQLNKSNIPWKAKPAKTTKYLLFRLYKFSPGTSPKTSFPANLLSLRANRMPGDLKLVLKNYISFRQKQINGKRR